ncbi:MAG: hypothetical protein PHO41_07395 [Eubacteriales bacterium]|nr:hypothetical protein [Eubacteriales bacterium]
MNNRLPSNAGVGVASILLIVIMLSMTVFASLSLLTAKNDETLTEKTAAYTRAYYAADAAAQRTIANMNAALASGGALPAGAALSFSIPVNDSTALAVTLRMDGENAYVIESYGVEPIQTQTTELEEESFQLWN